jgi:hypothetical protein
MEAEALRVEAEALKIQALPQLSLSLSTIVYNCLQLSLSFSTTVSIISKSLQSSFETSSLAIAWVFSSHPKLDFLFHNFQTTVEETTAVPRHLLFCWQAVGDSSQPTPEATITKVTIPGKGRFSARWRQREQVIEHGERKSPGLVSQIVT